MKKKLIMAVVIACIMLLIGVFCSLSIITQIKRVKTLDCMGLIMITLGRTLPIGSSLPKEYDSVMEAKKLFPEIPIVNHEIMDGWMNPIRISLKREGTNFQVECVSAGPDGIMGTKDDLVKKYAVPDENGNSGITNEKVPVPNNDTK